VPEQGPVTAAVAPIRIERDFLGEVAVPDRARYGIHTLRALENFPRVGARLGEVPELCRAFAMVKLAAARANGDVGALSPELVEAIEGACRELMEDGEGLREDLVVPLLQGGAGTSTNMNVNEVLANRALEHLGHARGDYEHCHPNDHVNRSQSTNDVYPTALRVALFVRHEAVADAVERLTGTLRASAERLGDVPKLGRTQLQDAVPMTVEQELSAWAVGFAHAHEELGHAAHLLLEINLGGTAIGTGLGAPDGYAERVVEHLAELCGHPVRPADQLVAATTDPSALLTYSGALRTAAVLLAKVGSDLCLLASGPQTGLGELRLPARQAGSSMMPGKVNPVIPEYASQAAIRIHGLDAVVAKAADAAQLQLNAMLPAAAAALLEAQDLLRLACDTLAERCVADLEADETTLRANARQGLGELVALLPVLGYDASSRRRRPVRCM
jgi:aspartate ammonia-lyase